MASLFDNFRSPLALFRFYGVCVTGLAIDLATKAIAEERLSGGERVVFIPGYINFEWVLNPGAVFGIGAGHRWLFVSVSVLALGFLTWLFASSRKQPVYQIILGMLLAGVLGNLYDRVMFAHVRDMIRALPRWPDLFPYVFNVADILLVTGVGMMLVHSVLHDFVLKGKPEGAQADGQAPQSDGPGSPAEAPVLASDAATAQSGASVPRSDSSAV